MSSLWHWLLTWFQQKPKPPTPKPPPDPPPIPEPLTALFDSLNEARADHGLELLEADARLDSIAQAWANTMRSNGVLAHGDFEGRLNTIYPDLPGAENIAQGQRNSEAVVQSWLDSPGHRKNMLNPEYVAVGCGRSGDFWCADFIGG